MSRPVRGFVKVGEAFFEVEFESQAAAESYSPPRFVGEVVTYDEAVSGAAVAGSVHNLSIRCSAGKPEAACVERCTSAFLVVDRPLRADSDLSTPTAPGQYLPFDRRGYLLIAVIRGSYFSRPLARHRSHTHCQLVTRSSSLRRHCDRAAAFHACGAPSWCSVQAWLSTYAAGILYINPYI